MYNLLQRCRKLEVIMNNEELLKQAEERFKKHTMELARKNEESYQRHMDILLGEHKDEIQTVGEGHSTLLIKINDLDSKVTEAQKVTEKQLDRIEGKLILTKNHEERLNKIEKKIGV